MRNSMKFRDIAEITVFPYSLVVANHHEPSNFIWQIAELLRGPYRSPQYERVMLPASRQFRPKKARYSDCQVCLPSDGNK